MVNVKVYYNLECAVKAQSRGKRYSCAPSLTSVLDGGGCQSQVTAAFFFPRELPNTCRTGGYVCPRFSPDECGKFRPYLDSIPRPSSL